MRCPEYCEKQRQHTLRRRVWELVPPATPETIEKRRVALTGKKKTVRWKLSAETRKKMSDARPKGENSPLWKGGITPINAAIRSSFEYKLWRTQVFERDDYRCVMCGARGVGLHADHIKPFAHHPELRFDLNNGRTLCVPCHKETPTYLWKASRVNDKPSAKAMRVSQEVKEIFAEAGRKRA